MRAERVRVGLAVLAGLLIGSLAAHAAEPPAPPTKPATAAPAAKKPATAAPAAKKPATAAPAAKKPTTAAPAKKSPLPDILAKMDKEVAERIATLADMAKTDEARVRARNQLVTDGALLKKMSVDALIELGKVADQLLLDHDRTENVRMHVAIALSKIGQRDEANKVVANYGLLKGWLESKDGDVAVRHWAALAIANTRTAEALKLLDKTLNGPAEGDLITCSAVASSIGMWRKRNQALALPVLLKMLKSQNPGVRIAGIEGLWLASVSTAEVILPLAKAAAADSDEPVWRAAEGAVNELTRGWPIRRMLIPVGAADGDRKEVVRVWVFVWEREVKKRAAKPKKG